MKRVALSVFFLTICSLTAQAGPVQYTIGGCESSTPNIKINSSGNTIHFQQIIQTYCNVSADNLNITSEIKGDAIKVIETFDAKEVAQCVCPKHISGTIPDLAKGKYKVTFVFENKFAGKTKVLGTYRSRLK